ncbi:dapper homolog 2 [Pangasianodon hypophthalmus]|uniref:dapper homolog 2 n=1 Tax=Pangasianodon hypophthalmus TaxID=310915 RepID=UPI002307E77C|nr:dapper homolog 2 [Pangasianodon hypophthalmus]
MLSRKSEMSGNAVVPAAVDRSRVAERLRAAFAGLQELQHLREKQGDMVQRALRMDTRTDTQSEPAARDVCLHQSDEDTNRAEEQQRLEATLTALKQQLTRLRRQDVGLKTHLQQLDQQISELKLDACKASAEHLESDSRPSSGFFELSDGGLGSLSNSCTSVYSECLSTSSQASLLPLSSGFSAAHGRNAQLQADVCRRRSADETTAQPDIPRGLGVRLGSSGIRTGSVSSERARQRPVSTGDLDRVINPGFGYYKPVDIKTSILSSKFSDPTVDPKYQSNLVSRNGSEVYCYPSPLHAVALQSPIFSLSGDKGGPVTTDSQEKHTNVGFSKDTLPKQEPSGAKPEGYIVKLLQRSSSKMSLQSELGVAKGPIPINVAQDHGLFGFRMKQVNDDEMQGSLQRKIGSNENPVTDGKKSPPRPGDKEQMNLNSNKAEEYRQMCPVQYSASTRNQIRTAVMGQEKVDENESRDRFDQGNGFEDASIAAKAPERRPSVTFPNEDNKSRDRGCTHTAKSEFVCAQFVPAGSQRVKVRQADKKTKAVKLRKRGHEKPTGKKHHLKHSSREHEKDKAYSTKTRGDRNPKQFSAEREWIDVPLMDPRLRSCSESSLLGPGNPCSTHLQSYRQQKHTSKSNKPPKAQFPDLENLSQKKQSSQKWPHVSEIQLPLAPPTHYQRNREMPIHRVSQKSGMVRSLSMRPRSGHWGGLPRPLQPSLSSSSYFSNLNLKYPPAPLSTHYPPRCESEYSAECASLFHSTIVESSEGELSDYTTNRFGDSESSQESQTGSDSDSSLSLDEDDLYEEDEDESGLVWAEATVGPTANGLSIQQHLRPEPASCRIKASRALKKKIRRFQPASLKVMTLV